MFTDLVYLTGMAVALFIAGLGLVSGRVWSRSVFAFGVFAAVGLLVLATTACSALPDSLKPDRQIAEEIVECQMEDNGGLGVAFMGGKDALAELYEQSSTR